MKKYFGTDGIRGIVGKKLTPEIAYSLGVALTHKIPRAKILVGRDTRYSGETLLHSFSSGVLAGGGKIFDCGIASTPAICFLTKNLDFDFGLVISASHNPPEHNGLKIFNSKGYKLDDEEELEIEGLFDKKPVFFDGICQKYTKILNLYYNFLKKLGRLSGLKIAVDCSNGATYKTAPMIFKSMGATVFQTGTSSDGRKINTGCGCLHIENLISLVKRKKADMGFAFDGDADRIIAVDEFGNIVDGDQLLFILSKNLETDSRYVVGTTHTNSAIEEELAKEGKILLRSDVGDKYVLAEMLKSGAIIGGEKAGHIILLDKNNSGDGLLTAITVANIVKISGKSLYELNQLNLYPQKTINIAVSDKSIISRPEMLSLRKKLSRKGRILLRASGTEDVVRIMCEAKDEKTVNEVLEKLEMEIKRLLNQ